MIVVDSSVWTDCFSGVENTRAETLDELLGYQPVVIGDLILTEVLQGFRHDKDCHTARTIFEDVTVFKMLGQTMAIKSADKFRALGKKGITVRKTADVIMATCCIEHTPSSFFR